MNFLTLSLLFYISYPECYSVLNLSALISASLRFNCLFGGLYPLQRQCQSCRGGHKRTIRGVCVISVAFTERPAMQKCQFSGFSAASRLSFRREIVTNDTKVNQNIKILV